MNWQNTPWKKVATIAGALAAFALAYLSYQYLAWELFYSGLSDFYNIAPTLTDECRDVVAYTAVAFAGIYDDVGLAVAAAFLVLGAYLTWRMFTHLIHKQNAI